VTALEIVDVEQLVGTMALMMELPAAMLAAVQIGAADIVCRLAVRVVVIFAQIIEAAFVNAAVSTLVVVIIGLSVEIAAGIMLAAVTYFVDKGNFK